MRFTGNVFPRKDLRKAGVPGSNPGGLIFRLNQKGGKYKMAKKKVVKKETNQPKRLFRSKENKILAGVCGGMGEYFKIDPVIIRLIWAITVLGYGFGILAYLVAWLVIPLKK